MDNITILQAEVLKTLASPRRLEILHAIAAGPIEVGRLAKAIGVSQPNVSQHLAVLRSAGLVEAERNGREVRYRLADPDVMAACGLMRARPRATADATRRDRGRVRRLPAGAASPRSPLAPSHPSRTSR